MIIADTSVWIDHLHGRPSPEALALNRLLGQEPILLGDLILHELLAGVRDDRAAATLREALGFFDLATMGGAEVAEEAARLYRALRAEGLTIRKTVDLFIGTFCILHGHILLQRDRDFAPMQRFGLRLWPG